MKQVLIACCVSAIGLATDQAPAQAPTPGDFASIPAGATPLFTPSADSPNAAERYIWLFASMNASLAKAAKFVVSDVSDFKVLANSEGVTRQTLEAGFVREQDWITQFIAATRLERCEFGPEHDLLVIHFPKADVRTGYLQHFSQAWRLIRADAVSMWCTGRRDQAVERMTAMVRLCVQLANDPRDPSHHMLVAAWISDIGTLLKTADQQPPARSLTAAHREVLAAALRGLDPDDPSGTRRSWRRETGVMLRFVRDGLADGTVSPQLRKQLDEVRGIIAVQRAMKETEGMDKALPRAKKSLPVLTPASVAAALAMASELDRKIDAAHAAPDAPARFVAFARTVSEDGTGVLMLALPNLDKMHEITIRERADLQILKSRLRRDEPAK